MKNVLFMILCLGLFTAVTGCNTIDGAGEDINQLGEQIEEL